MKTYTASDLEARYLELSERALAECVFTTELVGGAPADEAGTRAFVTHHLKLSGDEAEKAVRRILSEEIPKNTAGEEQELEERQTYGISILRRDEAGPWIGDWMVKACLKAAASRLGLFMSKRGSKGDVAEMGRVQAIGLSRSGLPERIHLYRDGGPAATYFQQFKGRVQAPSGSVSIVGDRECAAAGTCFTFEFAWRKGKLSEDDVVSIFAAAQNIGLGSAKAFERGKFRVDTLRIGAREAA